MNVDCRKYGSPPFSALVVHGGPGGEGEVRPVAERLSKSIGVIEPLLRAESLEGQVEELHQAILAHADTPVTLIGHSFGAMLAVIVAARYPKLMKKLIMVGSGSLEKGGGQGVMKKRLERLSKDERERLEVIKTQLDAENKDALFKEMGEIVAKADSFDPEPSDDLIECSYRVYNKVWADSVAFRESGKWLKLFHEVTCPIVAIHGEYDPHPIQKGNHRQVVLKNCGHRPWVERQANELFYETLQKEL